MFKHQIRRSHIKNIYEKSKNINKSPTPPLLHSNQQNSRKLKTHPVYELRKRHRFSKQIKNVFHFIGPFTHGPPHLNPGAQETGKPAPQTAGPVRSQVHSHWGTRWTEDSVWGREEEAGVCYRGICKTNPFI